MDSEEALAFLGILLCRLSSQPAHTPARWWRSQHSTATAEATAASHDCAAAHEASRSSAPRPGTQLPPQRHPRRPACTSAPRPAALPELQECSSQTHEHSFLSMFVGACFFPRSWVHEHRHAEALVVCQRAGVCVCVCWYTRQWHPAVCAYICTTYHVHVCVRALVRLCACECVSPAAFAHPVYWYAAAAPCNSTQRPRPRHRHTRSLGARCAPAAGGAGP